MSLNRIVICGRFVADPELRYTNSGTPVTSFSMAVDRNSKEKQTDFFNFLAWKNTAEYICKYFTKGRAAMVDGSLQTTEWTDKNGNKRTNCEIKVDNIYFADSRPSASAEGGLEQLADRISAAGLNEVAEEGDLPF